MNEIKKPVAVYDKVKKYCLRENNVWKNTKTNFLTFHRQENI